MSTPSKSSEDSSSTSSLPTNPDKVMREFILHNYVIQACGHVKYPGPNIVQKKVLPYFMKPYCEDLIICAPRHTGKTSGAILGILNSFLEEEKLSLAVLLAPTVIIAEAIYSLCEPLALYCNVVVNLPSKMKVIPHIKNQKTIFIGTPDKILELSRSSGIKLRKISFLLIDEADCLKNSKRYFDSVLLIHQKLDRSCRAIICTSFMSDALVDFTETHCYNPIKIMVEDEVARKSAIERVSLIYSNRDIPSKVEAIKYLITLKGYQGKTVIFCDTKDKAYELEETLLEDKIEVTILTGKLSHNSRKQVIEEFKNGMIKVLLTTPSFVSDLPIHSATKLIHYTQELDKNQVLDVSVYIKRESILSTEEKSLEVFFIEDIWVLHLLEDNDVVDKIKYLKNSVRVPSKEIKTYFS